MLIDWKHGVVLHGLVPGAFRATSIGQKCFDYIRESSHFKKFKIN